MRTRRVNPRRYPRSADEPCPLCGGVLDLTLTCVECDTHFKRPGEFDRSEEDDDLDFLSAEVWD